MNNPTRKLVASEWTSLDGVFDANSMDTWFNPFDSQERGQLIKAWIDAADALLYGRVTYEMLAQYWPRLKNNEFGIADRLNRLPKYVVSKTLKKADWNNSTIIADNALERIAELKKQAGRDILLFGSAALVRSLLAANLVDELRVLVHPVVVGQGKRAFPEGTPTARLELADVAKLPNGVLALTYRPAP